MKKSRIQETLNLSTDADHRTDNGGRGGTKKIIIIMTVPTGGIARRYVSTTESLGRYLDFQKKTLQKTEVRFLLLK